MKCQIRHFSIFLYAKPKRFAISVLDMPEDSCFVDIYVQYITRGGTNRVEHNKGMGALRTYALSQFNPNQVPSPGAILNRKMMFPSRCYSPILLNTSKGT